MTTATIGRDPFMPRAPKGRGPALALALLAHALLIGAIAYGVNWRRSEPTSMAAELWSAVPQAAAPRAVEPAPAPTPTPAPPVVKTPDPVEPPRAQTPTAPDPQIAIERAKREEAKREETKREEAKRAKLEREQDDRDKQRLKEEQARAAADKLKAEKAEAAKLAAAREANLQRMLGQAGATGGPTEAGTAARSSGPSASYAGRIMARIKPNIVFTDPVEGNPLATVEVKLAPDGTIIGKRLVKSSGVRAWDEAVMRAIERTEVLPRDIDGRVPPPFQIDFRPRDS